MPSYNGFILFGGTCAVIGDDIVFANTESVELFYRDLPALETSAVAMTAPPNQLASHFTGDPGDGYLLDAIPLAALAAFKAAALIESVSLLGGSMEYVGGADYLNLNGARNSYEFKIVANYSVSPPAPHPLTRTTGLKYRGTKDLTTASNFGSLFKYINWEN